ncbi:hypothetical protein AAG906_012575 [Vitis piasezkii]
MMTLGGGRPSSPYGRLTEIVVVYVGRPDALWRSSGCYVCECRVPLLEGVRIERRATQGFGMGMLVMWGFSTTSSGPSGDAHAEKSVDKLSVKEFRERGIPNGVSIELIDGEVRSIEKNEDHAIFFNKEEFRHFTQIPPAYLHPNMVRKVKNDIFSFVASLPSLQLVTSLPDSTKGAAKGHVLVKGVWAGLAVHPDRPFAPNYIVGLLTYFTSLGVGQDKRGKLVEWVEKASFDRLNRLFKIAAAERSCDMLLFAEPPFGHPEPHRRLEHTPKAAAYRGGGGEHLFFKTAILRGGAGTPDTQSPPQ